MTICSVCEKELSPTCGDPLCPVIAHMRRKESKQPAHTDHPLRHWDRTCPACIAETKGFIPIEDYIAEQEKIPERKAALDKAREELRRSDKVDELPAEQHLRDMANAFDPVEGAPSASEWAAIRSMIYRVLHVRAFAASATQRSGVFVPQDVWDWLMGEGPDFTPSPQQLEGSVFAPGRYWWRSELRRRIDATADSTTKRDQLLQAAAPVLAMPPVERTSGQ